MRGKGVNGGGVRTSLAEHLAVRLPRWRCSAAFLSSVKEVNVCSPDCAAIETGAANAPSHLVIICVSTLTSQAVASRLMAPARQKGKGLPFLTVEDGLRKGSAGLIVILHKRV